MNKLHLTLVCSAVAAFAATDALAQATLTPIATFGTNGWLAPGSTPYLSTGNTERGFAYNPVTGNLVLVARQNVGGISNNIRIFDGVTGADLGGLDNTGFAGGTFLVNMAGVDDSGAIYACNLSTSAASNFKVYKWDSEALGFTTPPTLAFDGVSGLSRTGDSFAVTGGAASPAQFAGAGTSTVSASNFVVGTLDGSNTSTAFLSVPGTGTASNDYRLALTFVDQNTLIGNQGGLARLTSFDTTTATATVAASIGLGGSAQRGLDYAVIGGRPVLAVIDSNSSTVTVFDITDPTSPVALATGNATTGTLASNANGTGAVHWGAIGATSATLYAMNSNQGIQAFTFDLSPLASATSYGTGCDGLALTSNGAPAFGNAAFELLIAGVPAISPVAIVGFGTTAVNPGIDLTSIGMPGCFGYTNLDLGLVGTGPVAAGVATYGLPVPNDPSLVGASLASQALALTLATPLALASSNGLEIVLGF